MWASLRLGLSPWVSLGVAMLLLYVEQGPRPREPLAWDGDLTGALATCSVGAFHVPSMRVVCMYGS